MIPYMDLSSLLQNAFNLFYFSISSIESFFNFTTLNCHIKIERLFVFCVVRTAMRGQCHS